jgi:hypothetical protein
MDFMTLQNDTLSYLGSLKMMATKISPVAMLSWKTP